MKYAKKLNQKSEILDRRPYSIDLGFTLIELLIVMAIMGILATLLVGGFQIAQMRGRDAQRKSDLKQLVNALELFYNDFGFYPASDIDGKILACPYIVGTGGSTCAWGTAVFTDNKTTYFKKMPADPAGNQYYFYRIVDSSTKKKFQIFAHLENPKDKDCLSGDCASPGVTYVCGSGIACNFAITSANTDAFEE